MFSNGLGPALLPRPQNPRFALLEAKWDITSQIFLRVVPSRLQRGPDFPTNVHLHCDGMGPE